MKAKKKCLNGISVPVDINVNELKGLLAEKIVNGEYTKTYKKLVLKTGIVNTELFTLQYREINLTLIRNRRTEKHEQFMKGFRKDYFNTSTENIIEYLKSINEFVKTDSNGTLRQKTKQNNYLTLWQKSKRFCKCLISIVPHRKFYDYQIFVISIFFNVVIFLMF